MSDEIKPDYPKIHGRTYEDNEQWITDLKTVVLVHGKSMIFTETAIAKSQNASIHKAYQSLIKSIHNEQQNATT